MSELLKYNMKYISKERCELEIEIASWVERI